MTEGIQRRLAAILAADVAGYSRLMGADEAGTLAALRALRKDLFEPAVANHRGAVVKRMGDGWLVEFASVADAVSCALIVQEELARRDTVELRIGVHLGDITHEDEDIYGDGVNIAARLQEIAEPGAIIISDIAWRSIDGKLSAAFADLGEQDLKNIAKPVTAYGWGMTAIANEPIALTLPDKPSIAVLPFDNMSGDPEQEYFADGIVDDLITALSRVREFMVIARNSSFTYKGRAVDVTEVGRELGVRYVIEGSVRKAGERVRITVQLIDSNSNSHLWADRYDRVVEDIFALQDEITAAIAAAIRPELALAEQERALRKPPESLDAYDLYYRGCWHCWQTTNENLTEGVRLLREACAIDPNFALAHARLASGLYAIIIIWNPDDWENLARDALDHGRRAVALDKNDAVCHYGLGRALAANGDWLAARDAFAKALTLDPNNVQGHHGLAFALGHLRQYDEALRHSDMAIRLSPRDPAMWSFLLVKAMIFYEMLDYDKAADVARQSTRESNARHNSWSVLAAALGQSGRIDEAQSAVNELLQQMPDATIRTDRLALAQNAPDPADHLREGLRKAGMPE